MKKTSKWITALLAVCMVIGLFAVTASAEEKKLLILGDSIAAAFGTENYVKNAGSSSAVVDGSIIEGSYADLVAKEIGAVPSQHAHGGWGVRDFVSFVVKDMSYDDLDEIGQTLIRGLASLEPEAIAQTIEDEKRDIPNEILASDYISINFGSNDIFTYSLITVTNKYVNEIAAIGIPDLSGIRSFNDISAAVSSLLGTAKDIVSIVSLLESTLDVGLANFKEAYPQMIQYITEKNPNAKVFVNSVACPLRLSVDLNENISLKIRTKSNFVIDNANAFLKNLCAQYDNVYYVDTAEAENYSIDDLTEEDLSILSSGIDLSKDVSGFVSLMKIVHPNEAGHIYITEQILDAMARSEIKPEATVKYNILGQVHIQWNKIDGAVNYFVYRATEENGEYSLIGTTPTTGLIDAVAPADTTCYYKVAASMDVLGTRLTEESDAVSFSTHFQPAIGRTISTFIKTLTNMIKGYFKSPLFAAKVITSLVF